MQAPSAGPFRLGRLLAKKLFIKSYGCQMNVYDSARMAELMAAVGYAPAAAAEDADMVILNTCHIREKAAEKIYSDLGRLARLKESRAAAGRELVIAVAGCVAQAEGEEVVRRAPCVDIVVGPQTYHRLPTLLSRRADGPAIALDFPVEDKFAALPARRGRGAPAAFLSIQEGCDKFCAFCVVPYTRGAEFSRPVAAIVAEAESLVAGGAREITLLGQNVNAYCGAGPDGKDWGLAALLARLAEIPGLDRLRYTTSHPCDMTDELIAAHGALPALMPFLHLPVQSGSDRVLAAMNRRHSADDYLRIVEKLRAARPDIALGSDFIVGFPGETEADFEATLALARAVGFAQAYAFKFSPRPGTPAAAREDQISEAEKAARLEALQALLAESQAAFNRAFIGRSLPVLFERAGRHPGQLVGRSPYMQAVHARLPDAALGRIVTVEIADSHPHSLEGVASAFAVPAPERSARAAEVSA